MHPKPDQLDGPHGEAGRLARLRELMVPDTGPEPALDNLAALASQVCGVPIGLLSLVDEGRQCRAASASARCAWSTARRAS